jgi:hypothetical protein
VSSAERKITLKFVLLAVQFFIVRESIKFKIGPFTNLFALKFVRPRKEGSPKKLFRKETRPTIRNLETL